MMSKVEREIETTWGKIEIGLLNGRVVRCALPFLAEPPDCPFTIKEAGNDSASRFVTAILAGKKAKAPTLGTLEGSAFQQEVWQAIARIPFGKAQTYGELARAIGRPKAYRAVANACGKNPVPLFVPCHRVVAASGKIGGFFAKLPWKKCC
jgi:O-6-methylguanine DNA methyltransferase